MVGENLNDSVHSLSIMNNGTYNALETSKHIERKNSTGKFSQETVPEGRVLVLYTGGTIGMVRNENGCEY